MPGSSLCGMEISWNPRKTPCTDFGRPFNERQVSLIVYLSPRDRCPYFLMRTYHLGIPWFSLRGAHELCVERESSTLQFWRWSTTEGCAKLWASLCFMTWEGKHRSGLIVSG